LIDREWFSLHAGPCFASAVLENTNPVGVRGPHRLSERL
jgi:hypothetical protein